ncbi:MAG: nucleotide exchange factor GrpE [Candidatus Hodarchaeota archaeon]
MSQKNTNSDNKNESEFIDIDYQIEEAEIDRTSSTSKEKEKNSTSLQEITDNNVIEELKSLYKQIEEKDAQYNKIYSRYLRALADYENLEKRTKSEKQRIIKQANENLLLKLIDLADTFEKAEKNLSSNEMTTLNSVVDGFKAIHKQFRTILKNEGIKRIKAQGKKFDPNFHEVVFVKFDSNIEEETILEEIQSGFLLNSELLRPTKVVVAKKPTEEVKNND